MEEKPPRLDGGCLCGAVTFSVQPKSMAVDACHCRMCRRNSGGVGMALDCEPDSLTLMRDDGYATYRSSEWAERSHCKICGSALFYRTIDGSFLSVSAGAFNELPGATFTTEIFIDEKPAFYSFAQDTKKMTGEEVFALFASQQDQTDA